MSPIHLKSLLVIDDDRLFCDAVAKYYFGRDVTVLSAHTGANGIELCSKEKINVVLLDQKLPDRQGIELCEPILECNDRIKIIFNTAYPSFHHAVQAMRLGAYDYLSKPCELEELDLAVQKAFRTVELERVEQIQNYRNQRENAETVLIGKDKGLSEVYQLVQLCAQNAAPVLITGETGSGKNVIAKTIHYMGSLKNDAFISINCAAIPENLMESELFGHEKGAFTGAVTAKKGIFEMAEGGTLFLDEIGELPLNMQSKLLGVLDEHKVKRVGAETMRPVDVRIIAATNKNIETAIAEKKFRQDLFYRLSVMQIHTPPLRERLDDIAQLVAFFIQKMAPTPNILLTEGEIAKLKRYDWPGNVRELRNIIERSIFLRKNDTIQPSQLIQKQVTHPPGEAVTTEVKTFPTLEQLEDTHIRKALQLCGNNHTHTASALGISRSTLMRKLKKYGIS
jgi:DNA-binding NtrC family response regulator